jgi:hypothetical protein
MRQAAANRVSMRRPERKFRKISKYLYMNKDKVERGTIFKCKRTFTGTTASSPSTTATPSISSTTAAAAVSTAAAASFPESAGGELLQLGVHHLLGFCQHADEIT